MGRRRKKNRTATGALGALAGDTLRSASWFPAADTDEAFRPRDWLFAAALVVAVFLAYQPAWQGGFIWDDDTHLLNNPVLTPGGLFRTWVPGTYVNYWPLTFTAYWVEYQLWGLAPVGFHLVNIALHALSAILIWRVLALLRVPGAAAGGGPVCAAPGQRRERGLDHATEKHPVVGADAAFRAAVFALGAGPGCRAGLLGRSPACQVPPVGPACRAGLLGARPTRAAPSPASRSRLPGGTLGGADPTANPPEVPPAGRDPGA